MKSQIYYFGLVLLSLCMACGKSSATVQVNVLTSPGNAAIKTDIKTLMQNAGHRGVFFIVRQLNSPLVSNDDFATGGASLTYPNSEKGFDPTQTKFNLKSGQLDQTRPYAVEMVALDAAGEITHLGLSDCYVDFLRPDLNTINICFRAEDDATACPGYQPFSACN